MIPKKQEIKERKEKKGNKRFLIIVPLVVMLMLICVAAIIYVAGARASSPEQIAEIDKDIDTKEEKISAAVDIAATSIGTNVNATFTVSTGKINIYGTSSSTAKIDKAKWYSFLKKIVDLDGNLDAVRTIVIGDDFYTIEAPVDSSRLFYPIISNTDFQFRNLASISISGRVSFAKTTTFEKMFYGCSSLTSFELSDLHSSNVSSMVSMFEGCTSLNEVIWESAANFQWPALASTNKMFKDCTNLTKITLPRESNVPNLNASDYMFENCSSLKNFSWKANLASGDSMFRGCSNLESIVLFNGTASLNEDFAAGCVSLKSVDFGSCESVYVWDGVFDDCASLEVLVMPLSTVYYGKDAYANSGSPYRACAFFVPNGNWFIFSEVDNVTKFTKGDYKSSSGNTGNRREIRRLVDYTISYNLNGGDSQGNPNTYSGISGTIALNPPTKAGYRFTGWTGSNGNTPQKAVAIDARNTTGNLSYTANWEQDIAEYQVRHWKQNINGNAGVHNANNYTLADTEKKTGGVGSSVTPPVNTTYVGFDAPRTQTVTIASSGTVVDYYYTRKSFTVTLNRGTGISSVSGANTYVYGANVTIDAEVSAGYSWLDWSGTQKTTTKRFNFTMPSANVTYTASATPNTNTKYVVRHWQQKVNGNAGTHNDTNYTLVDTENKTGTTGANVTPPVKSATEYVGFIPPGTQTKAIAGNGSTVIDYYYARQSYSVTLNKGTGIDTVTGGGRYVYGANVTINATLLPGYSWKNWTGTHSTTTQSHTFTMPAGEVIDTANATIDTYRITYNLNGGEVTGNPESYTAETSSFTLVNPTRAGYTFIGWTGSNGETAEGNVTISKGSTGDKNYIANWTANTDTPYMVRHWKQNIDGRADAQNEYNYTIMEREELKGTTDTEVTPGIKTYEGFTSPEAQTKTILGDGSLIIDYYYTRNKYTVTLNKGKGVAAVLGDGEYAYGDEVTINVMILAGYDWVKWAGEMESRDLKVTFTMPSKNIEFTTVTMPNPNTTYTIKHWKQKLEGKVDDYENGYELADTDVLTGETDSRVSPETKDYEGFKKPDADGISVPITGEGTLVIDYFYKRNSYEVKLNKGKGIEEIIVTGNVSGEGKDSYLYEEEVTIKAEVAPGYTWDKWIVGAPSAGIPEGSDTTVPDIEHSFTIGLENVEYTAMGVANENTPYTVKHWQQTIESAKQNNNNDENINPNDYALKDTDELTGTTDEDVTPELKEYEGFLSPEKKTEKILGDGTLVVNYYYTRNTNTPYKVEHWLQKLEGQTDLKNEDNYTKEETDELEGITGERITPEVKDYEGFTAPEAEEVEILADGSLVVKYYYTRNTNTPYVVKHWKENLLTENNEIVENNNTDNYTLADTDELEGTTGETVTPEVKDYEGFLSPEKETVEIKADGSLEVNYYYTRNRYTVTLNKGTGIEYVKVTGEIGGEGKDSYLYEEQITIEAEIKPGYTWKKWEGNKETQTQTYTFEMPAENVENTATATANTNTPYVVKHWKQNLGGNVEPKDEENYTLVETYEYTGTTDSQITPEPKQYAGFTSPEGETVTIKGDGTLEVNYYYTRNTDTGYVVKHWTQNLNGNAETKDDKNYTLIDTENLTGTTEETISPETKEYDGFITPEKETTAIEGDGTTEINYYYVRRGDLTCIVQHKDKGTGKNIFKRTIKNLKYEEEIDGNEEITDIEDYSYDSMEPEKIKIGTGENIINIYYTKNEGKIIIHHYIYDEKENEYTTNKLVEDEEKTGKIGEQYTTTKSSQIPSNYEVLDETPENYTGIIEEGTKEITYYYKLKTPTVESEVGGEITSGGKQDEEGNWEIKAGEEIKYKVKYKTEVEDYKGKVKIEIKAKLPEGTEIDITRCQLAGGTYDRGTNTIKWEKEIENVDTFENGKYTEEIEKEITIVYARDYVLESIELDVTGKTILYYPGEEDKPLTEDEANENGKVIIHHYIYDEKENEYTTTKLVEDEEITKKVGKQYTTSKSSKIPENYTCINSKPEGYEGIIEKETKEITYYYKLKKPTIDSSGEGEIVSGGEQGEDGRWSIKAGEEIKYKAKYETEIEDYKGKVKIEMKAKLPEGTRIEEERCNLNGGTYDAGTNTITWTQEIEGVNTFVNGNYKNQMEKEITIVYAENYTLDDIGIKVDGKTTLYYPEGETGGEDKPLIEDETDEKGKIIIHHYIYKEKEDEYTTTKLVENEEIKEEIGTDYETKASDKIPSNYECINEEPEGYKGKVTKETIKVNYYYKLKTPTQDGKGEGEIISGGEQGEDGKWNIKAGEEIKYKAKYKTEIKDYKGKARIEMKAELPKGTKIDKTRCKLNGGTYDERSNTITWTQEIEGIDTFAHKEQKGTPMSARGIVDAEDGIYVDGTYTYEMEKEITIIYAENYELDDIGIKVDGKTTLYYPEDYPGTGDEPLTEEEIKRKGQIIIHHYIYKEKENEYTKAKVVEDEEIREEIGKEYTTSPSDKIPSNYECINEEPEGYKGIIEKGTKEINYYYKLKTPETESEIETEIISGGKKDEEGNWEIKAGEEIKYKIKYSTKIKEYKGKARIEIKAELPEGTKIEEGKCELDGGTYEEETNTISWEKEIENIDTFEKGTYEENIEKEITIVYAEDYVLEDINLKVSGKTILYYPEGYPEEKDEPLIEDEAKEKGEVIVHHYIYDEEDEKYTTVKLVEDETIKGQIGENYTTSPSNKIPSNYECINEKPEGNTGKITKEEIEITYYYKLRKAETEGNGSSGIISGGQQDEEGNWIIKGGEEIEYEIRYEAKIENYIGKAKIEIKAELPEGTKIDISKSDLNGGTYDEKTNVITWEKEIENINTFENGAYTETIIKNIKIVYAEDYILKDANLKVTGKITTYYPDDYPEKGGQEIPEEKEPDNPENKQGKVIVKYVDVETEEGAYEYEITGKVGEEYETKEKEIKYYVLVRVEGNTKGEIKEEEQRVTYYYRKLNFNIGIEKTIEGINLNGKNIEIKNKETAKIEIMKKDISKTEIIVKYKIKVINTGELGGTSKVLEQIPEGYELAYLPEYWKINRDETLETKVELGAGESRELEVVLRWKNKEENLGAKTNIAKIEETKNEANFKDTKEEDNLGEATIIISIKTGETVSIVILMMIITSLGICSYITICTIRKKEPDIKDIKFLK